MNELVSCEIIVFNGDAFLEEAIRAIAPFMPIYVVEGPVRFFRDLGFTTSTDRTNEILHDLLPENNVVHGQFEEKDDEVNAIADRIKSDFIFAVDADEIWSPESISKILSILESGEIDSMAFRPYSFFGGFSRYMQGFEENWPWLRVQRWGKNGRWHTHRPPTVLAPDGGPWQTHRHLDQYQTDSMGIRFSHFSYVMPKATFYKTTYYESQGGTIPNWFRKIFIPWVLAEKSGDDNERARIELENSGVHNWEVSRRGDCYTVPFAGQHPKVIQDSMPRLKERFERELALYQENDCK